MNGLGFLSEEIAQIAKDAKNSVVRIVGRDGSLGAGTIWHSEGLIVTNAHVVHGRSVQVLLAADDEPYSATVLAEDTRQDIAALAVDTLGNFLPTIPLGDSRKLRVGQWVMALGHPWGVRYSLTAGALIGFGGDLPEMETGREWLALGLHLRPGHSGGPLLNTDGELIGINTMITGPEVGFAIPVHIVKAFLKETVGFRNAEPV
jgi:serine protease Do